MVRDYHNVVILRVCSARRLRTMALGYLERGLISGRTLQGLVLL